MRAFAELAAEPDPRLDLLALALAAEFRDVDPRQALAKLDVFGAELAEAGATTPEEETRACSALLGEKHGFTGDRERYDHPENSMLDVVLSRRRGLPILLSVVYVEAARRAGIALAGVGLPGHFVVGHFGAAPPLLLDPFAGGVPLVPAVPDALVRPWGAAEIAMRMLTNLVAAYGRRGDLALAIRAAELRLALPAEPELRATLEAEARALRSRLN
jgi:regulator of sirC expression with transglutaminase-like and TPR domain